jgi:hypothetical protein
MFERLPVEDRVAAVRAVGIAMAILVVPLRLWSLVAAPDLAIYALYPLWLQVATVAVFAWLGGASLRLPALSVRRAAAVCLMIATATTAVMAVASIRAGAWVWWACASVVCGWVYLRSKGL